MNNLGLAVAGASLALTAVSAHAQEHMPPHMMQQASILSVNATAEVNAAPDIADIEAGVVTQATDAAAALQANSEKMNRVVAALKKAGIAPRDIRTTGINLQPQYRYDQGQPPVMTGFQASNRVQVTLRKLDGAGKVIDTLVKEGANQIDGPTFRVNNSEALLDQARVQAVKNARARADLLASAAGMKVKRILSIDEGSSMRPPMPVARMAAAEASLASAPPIAPGELGLVASVSMRFEME